MEQASLTSPSPCCQVSIMTLSEKLLHCCQNRGHKLPLRSRHFFAAIQSDGQFLDAAGGVLLPELGRHIGSLGDTALKKKLARLRDLLMCPTDIARVEVGILLQVTDRLTLRGARYSAFTDCHVLLVLPTHMPSSATSGAPMATFKG